jgi:hypothetical protein
LLPGLRLGFGSAWTVIIAITVLAMAFGMITLRHEQLVPPIAGAVALGAFVITPGTVWAPQLHAQFVTTNLFAFNLRYLLPAVAVGLTIVPLSLHRWRAGRSIATGALGLAISATQLGSKGNLGWSGGHAAVALEVGGIATVGTAILVAGVAWPTRSTLRPLAAAILVLIVGVVGWPIQERYRRDRFGGLELANWAAQLHGARIGFSGFVFSYPIYGPRLQNLVQMVGEQGPDGAWHPVLSCDAWRRQVRQDRLQYVVVPVGGPNPDLGIDLSRWRVGLPGGEPPAEPPESRWERDDPGATLVIAAEGAAVYRVSGPATDKNCS